MKLECVAPGLWRLRLGLPEAVTPVALRDTAPLVDAMAAMGGGEHAPFAADAIAFKTTARGCVATLPMDRDEDIYGFGLQLKSHRQTGRKKTIRVNADPVADTGDSHAPVPFYVSTRGYGVFVDTVRYATFYCGTHPSVEALEADPVPEHGQPIGFESYRQRRLRQPRAMMIEIPVAHGIDLYFFAGPTLKDAVRRYVLFSGGGAMPPMWGLGYYHRPNMEYNAEQVLEQAEGLRRAQIPCDVLGLEPGWHSHSYPCTYRWDPKRFPDPEGFLARVRAMGFKVNLWEHAFVHPASALHEPLKPFAADYPGFGGMLPDLSLPEARAIFADHHARELVAKGIDAFKLDECDNSDFGPVACSFPEHTAFPSGLDGEQMHSLLGVLYQRTIESIFRRANRRSFGEVRSSHALAAPLPFVLYSDLYDHGDFIRGVVNAGFSGLLWSPEVRESATSEELLRRMAAVAFSAQTMVNAWYLNMPPWLQIEVKKNVAGEKMKDWREVEAACRTLIEWRMRLVPYLYSAFARYRFEGVPPIRALVIDWPEDPALRDADDAYMLGDSLLVAPMIAGQASRTVRLPEGRWFDFWTREPVEGGRVHEVTASAGGIPVFVRDGSIVPLAAPVQFISPETVFNLEVLVFGEPAAPFTLFEDDGLTFDFEQGAFNRLELAWSKANGPTVRREGNYAGFRYNINRWATIDG